MHGGLVDEIEQDPVVVPHAVALRGRGRCPKGSVSRRSSVARAQFIHLPKLDTRVRFPSPAPIEQCLSLRISCRAPSKSHIITFVVVPSTFPIGAQLGLRDRSGEAIDRALVYTDHRLYLRAETRAVLCHGDPHLGNLLEVTSPRPGAPEGFAFVDPDGIVCEPEYDLGVVMRGFNRLVLAAEDPVVEVRGWCATLASLTDTDAEAIWQWSFIERVSAGLYLIEQGWPERGKPFLEAASWLIARKAG